MVVAVGGSAAIVNEYYEKAHEKNTKAGATSFGYDRDRVRGFMCATRMLHFTFSLPAALVCLSPLSLYLLRCVMLIVGCTSKDGRPAKSARRSDREDEDMTHAYL
jgi:hypothetical protein